MTHKYGFRHPKDVH